MKTSSSKRSPKYISAATRDIYIQITSVKRHSDNQALTPIAASYDVNVPAGPGSTVGPPAVTCVTDPSNAGNFKCTTTLQMTIGDNTFDIQAWSGTNHTGSLLSEQKATQQIFQGAQNDLTYSLDGNVNTLIVNGSGSCQFGPVGTVFGSVGTTPVTFTVVNKDASGNVIVNPGLPTIKIKDNTATYQSTSGTINASSGGTVGFTITQSTQSFTLTPSSSSVTNAPIDVEVVPPSGTDGLSFTKQQPTFQFSTGVAPPTHAFLAAVEQSASNAGQVDFFNVALGGSGGPDTFAAFSPATLAVTNSTNEGKPDVDNPESLHWDSTGDLLVGNGHDGSVNSGNMACVPIGAISTGANTSTTVSTNVSSPTGMAYDSRDGSVALANLQPGATYNLSEYLLTGNYTAAPAAQNIKVAVANVGANGGIANITSLPAGSYAIALTDGGEQDTTHNPPGGHSEIALINGTTHAVLHITDNETSAGVTAHGYAIDQPWGLAWDAANSQLVIGGNSAFHKNLSFYDASGNFVKVVNTLHVNNIVAASPDGHVAVAQLATFLGYPQVQVYDNTAARNPVFGPIPFNGETGACPGPHIYGSDTAIVQSLEWLSNTKLLIGLKSTSAGVYTAQNGLYIYDISTSAVPAGYNDTGGCPRAAFAAAPANSGFHQLSARPFGTAYKP